MAVQAWRQTEIAKGTLLPLIPRMNAFPAEHVWTADPWTAFQGEILEYWVNLECAFCGIEEPLKAQRDNPICVLLCGISPRMNMANPSKKP